MRLVLLLALLAPALSAQPVERRPTFVTPSLGGDTAWVASAVAAPPAPDRPVLYVSRSGPDELERRAQVVFSAVGLAFGTVVAVVAWPEVFREVPEGGDPAIRGLAEGFRYGFVLPVAVGGTVLAGYSGYRLVVLL